MKPPRISADHLRWLRNQIPIDRLIETLFMAPGTTCQGLFDLPVLNAIATIRPSKKRPILPDVLNAKKTSTPSIW